MLVSEHKKCRAMFCCMSQERIPKMFLSKFRSLADSEVQLHVESLLTHLIHLQHSHLKVIIQGRIIPMSFFIYLALWS